MIPLASTTAVIAYSPVQSAFWDGLWSALGSPSGQFAFGMGLFYGVQKFFKEVEDKLRPETRINIWMWLSGVKTEDALQSWPTTFVQMFDRVFGSKHLTWRCFFRSCLASLTVFVAGTFVTASLTASDVQDEPHVLLVIAKFMGYLLLPAFVFGAIPDYFSLLETRWMLRFLQHRPSPLMTTVVLSLDFYITCLIVVLSSEVVIPPVIGLVLSFGEPTSVLEYNLALLPAVLAAAKELDPHIVAQSFTLSAMPSLVDVTEPPGVFTLPFVLPSLVTSAWLWLYVGSGLLLNAARRFDAGFERIKRWFDIENKPLQAICLVSGVIVAVVY